MRKLYVVSFVLAAALAVGCSKKKEQTTPTNTGGQTEMKKEDGAMGGATYGGTKTQGGGEDPCAAPK